MTTKKDGKKIVYNALKVMLLTPDIRTFLEKRDPKALKQLQSADDLFCWACDYTPEPVSAPASPNAASWKYVKIQQHKKEAGR